jgi:hypothetical protein
MVGKGRKKKPLQNVFENANSMLKVLIVGHHLELVHLKKGLKWSLVC